MKLFKKIENLFAASAFAEAGEFDTAREIAAEEVEEAKGRSTAGTARKGAGRGEDRQLPLKGARSES